MQKEESRIYLFDNLKAVLIILVVFGHSIEPILAGKIKLIYLFIYLFHMPLFSFCSGYLAKYNEKKLLTNMVYPFILFQILYCVFDKICLNHDTLLQFTTPYWIMWYLLVLIVWTLALPIIKVFINNKKGIIVIICFSILLGIIAGFNNTIGYYMSLSRMIYFLPFFIIGFCIKNLLKIEVFIDFISKWYIKYPAAILTFLSILWLFFYYQDIDVRWFYGFYSYSLEGYYFTTRMILYLFAAVISLFLISLIPKEKIFFSCIGQKALSIYLLHGFIIRLISKYELYNFIQNQYYQILLASLITALIVFLLSSELVQKMATPLLSFPLKKRNPTI